MNALTTVPTLWGHIHVVVEVGTNWLLMDTLVKVYLYSSYSHYVIVISLVQERKQILAPLSFGAIVGDITFTP